MKKEAPIKIQEAQKTSDKKDAPLKIQEAQKTSGEKRGTQKKARG